MQMSDREYMAVEGFKTTRTLIWSILTALCTLMLCITYYNSSRPTEVVAKQVHKETQAIREYKEFGSDPILERILAVKEGQSSIVSLDKILEERRPIAYTWEHKDGKRWRIVVEPLDERSNDQP